MPSSKGNTASAPARSISSPDDAGTIVFVEVKTKTDGSFGDPVEEVTPQKQRQIIAMGEYYATYCCPPNTPCRFDVVAVDLSAHAGQDHRLPGRLQPRMVSHRSAEGTTWSRLSSEPIRSPAAPSRSISDRSPPGRLRARAGAARGSARAMSVLRRSRSAMPVREILAWREGGPANVPGWSVRVVPNRNPMLRIEGRIDVRSDGLFESRDGLGAHEVIIETPIHDQPLHTLDVDRLWRVLWAWRTRIHDLKRDARLSSVVIFKNHGRRRGARLDHSHSQLTAFPLVPPALADKLRGAARALGDERHMRILRSHVAGIDGPPSHHQRSRTQCSRSRRIASRVPFETWLMPRDHSAAVRRGVRCDAARAGRGVQGRDGADRLGARAAGLQPGAAHRAARRGSAMRRSTGTWRSCRASRGFSGLSGGPASPKPGVARGSGQGSSAGKPPLR